LYSQYSNVQQIITVKCIKH